MSVPLVSWPKRTAQPTLDPEDLSQPSVDAAPFNFPLLNPSHSLSHLLSVPEPDTESAAAALDANDQVTKYLTAKQLFENPKLLLHNADPDSNAAVTPLNGHVGAVLDEGHYFVTSPTENVIPDPQIKGVEVYLRQDFRFAFVRTVIHRQPSDHNAPEAIWWWEPHPRDLILDASDTISGLGRLAPHHFSRFGPFLKEILEEADQYRLKSTSDDLYIGHCSVTIRDSYARLRDVSSPFNQMRATLIEVQRAYLELRALLDYFLHFRPLLQGTMFSTSKSFSHKLIGAFVTDIQVAEHFYVAGIPYWLIRPVEHVSRTQINALVSVQSPGTFVEVQPARNSRVIFKGLTYDPKKYDALRQHMYSFMAFKNPYLDAFTMSSPSSKSSMTLSSALVPELTLLRSSRPVAKTKTKGKPYQKPVSHTAKAERDKFAEPASIFCPRTTESWSLALRNVDQNVQPSLCNVICTGYLYPDPGLFFGVETHARMLEYLISWLQFRPAFLLRAARGAVPIPPKQWRLLLNLANVKQGSDTRNGKQRALVEDLLRNVLDDLHINPQATNRRLEWNEVLWELSELNFRFELSSLDIAHTKLDRVHLIAQCLPTSGAPLLVPDIHCAHQGLAASTLRDHAPYFLALSRLMSAWKNGSSLGTEANRDYASFTDSELERIESKTFQFYTQSFFNMFGRACIIPRRLDAPIL
ncbi:hypothetical protein C8J56DRAFT_1157539 [Mycena floridula]|nr:hypothetical protein C8J56DRAFT_1157539 [Mycena floridula]